MAWMTRHLVAVGTALAAEVGPGGYQMTTYYVAFLYRGPRWTPQETAETKKIQEQLQAYRAAVKK